MIIFDLMMQIYLITHLTENRKTCSQSNPSPNPKLNPNPNSNPRPWPKKFKKT